MAFRLMCMTAHPDDEAGAFGGALLMARAHGVETSVICLTEGSAGSYRTEGQSDEDLARARREEFTAACSLLGVRSPVLLDYRDGALYAEPFQPLVGVLVGYIRRLRPHVMLTFGADGGVNLHRDHTIISLAATAAFHWAGRSGFYPEQLRATSSHATRDGAADGARDGVGRSAHTLESARDGDRAQGKDSSPKAHEGLRAWAPQKLYYSAPSFISTRDEEAARTGARAPASLKLELGAWKDRKIEAFLEHGSQRGVLERVRAEFEEHFEEEGYLLVAARTPMDPDDALFTGVIEE